ncbi:MAG: tetratricopeptide repeat protein [Verrucomicrobia bacterium]|jgi:tetratricopeptide (TPR) repeat protein|nr:tetratricopeptide repeat protein [Verrucomicrobiota bacterium]MBT7066605.1 tetratricopeptide repeat protein [Verrucomicrobiota bacterium]MBT7699769.1 tetratricopeptide repeat protein [Verrucomicrobiota bacterium]
MRASRSILLSVSVASLFVTAAGADIISATMKFSSAYELLVKADRARDEGEPQQALTLYKYALNTYTEMATEDPDFQPDMVQFRMAYCDSQMDALLEGMRPAGADAPHGSADPSNIVATVMALDAAPPGIDPATVRELLISARRKLEEGEPEAARALLLLGFKTDPDNADLRLMAGLAQCQARKFGDAIFLLGELVDEQPSNAPVRVGLAAAYFGDGQTNAAQRELEAAIALEPDLKEAHYNMAQLFLAAPAPDIEAVTRHYQRARELGAAPDLRVETAISKP